jgi:hypothetical protein
MQIEREGFAPSRHESEQGHGQVGDFPGWLDHQFQLLKIMPSLIIIYIDEFRVDFFECQGGILLYFAEGKES